MQIEFNHKMRDVKTLFSEEKIKERVKEIADNINRDFNLQESLVILIVLNGSFIFAADLVRFLEMPTEINTTHLSSYEGINTTGVVKLLTPLPQQIEGKNILIIEDIVETGKTLEFLLNELKKKEVKSIKICTLLNKPESHETSVALDYIGFNIGKNFVIGYGLDLDGKYRNLPYIAELLL